MFYLVEFSLSDFRGGDWYSLSSNSFWHLFARSKW